MDLSQIIREAKNAYAMLGDRMEAEDVSQEAFIKVYTSFQICVYACIAGDPFIHTAFYGKFRRRFNYFPFFGGLFALIFLWISLGAATT
ncbi:hypothetical protein [Ferviditalea candida]|uniref:RNA polymerase sigma-70 region 2 domain-containing protein n=1 Tax=Ferviditalea candida TaxID=3108399 RepID=A0ABU5ZDY1_9BACL|nr:hypothetical protein [Paenibacillaceae bacterium T2]